MLGDELVELGEEGVGVVGAGGGFGVVLYGENGAVLEAESFNGLVVEVDLGDDGTVVFEFFLCGGEAVVLGGDGNFSGFKVFHGLVAAAVPEFELKGFCAEGVGNDLVAEADAEGRIMLNEFFDGGVGVGDGGGVAGAVGKEESLGVEFADRFGRGVGGEDVYVEAVLLQATVDGIFSTEVEGRDFETLLRDGGGVDVGTDYGERFAGFLAGGPVVGGGCGDFFNKVNSDESAEIAGFGDGGFIADVFSAETGVEGSGYAEFFGDGAGVHAFEAGYARFGEVVLNGLMAAPVTGERAHFAYYKTAHFGAIRFNVFGTNAVVADLDGGHRDDLGKIGRVGQDFLVSGHAGVEAGFSGFSGGGSKGSPAENCSVFKCEYAV